MAKHLGRLAQLELSFNGGVSWGTYLGRIVDLNRDLNVDEIDVTTHDSSGFREYLPNLKDGQFTANVMYDDQDPGQAALQQAIEETTTFLFRYKPIVAAGQVQFAGTGFVTQASQAAPLDGMQTIDVTIRISGAVVREAQT